MSSSLQSLWPGGPGHGEEPQARPHLARRSLSAARSGPGQGFGPARQTPTVTGPPTRTESESGPMAATVTVPGLRWARARARRAAHAGSRMNSEGQPEPRSRPRAGFDIMMAALRLRLAGVTRVRHGWHESRRAGPARSPDSEIATQPGRGCQWCDSEAPAYHSDDRSPTRTHDVGSAASEPRSRCTTSEYHGWSRSESRVTVLSGTAWQHHHHQCSTALGLYHKVVHISTIQKQPRLDPYAMQQEDQSSEEELCLLSRALRVRL